MGLSWQQGPLSSGAIGRFLAPEPLPKRLLYAEPLRRRTRVRFDGTWIADSEDVLLLFEPGRYPMAYFPETDVSPDTLQRTATRHPDLGPTCWYAVRAGEKSAPRGAWQHIELPAYASELQGRVAFAWPAMDAFYEEGERIVGHAADSYHGIDIRQTSRRLVVRSQYPQLVIQICAAANVGYSSDLASFLAILSMALVVFLRGVNVRGHRRFRPSIVARELSDYDVVNVSAAGTFVVRKPGSRAKFRNVLLAKLPFQAEVVLCDGRDLIRLENANPFGADPFSPDVVRFVSILSKAGEIRASLPIAFPSNGEWLVRVLASKGQFVFGVYRRHMRTITYLGQIDKLYGAPATTRNWNTILAIVRILKRQRNTR